MKNYQLYSETSMKNTKQTEAEIQAAIREYLSRIGAFHIRHMAGAITRGGRVVAKTYPGTSDLICCIPYSLSELEGMGLNTIGVFCAIETKAEGWKPPKLTAKTRKHYNTQAKFINDVKASKGFGCFTSSIDNFIDGLNLRGRF